MSTVHAKCWECGWYGPGVRFSCIQAPPGPVFSAIMAYQTVPFICIGCLGTAVNTVPVEELAKLARDGRIK